MQSAFGVAALFGAALQIVAGPVAAAMPLTLEEAWRVAEERNAALRTAMAARHAAEGQRAEARGLLWNNPALALERSRTRFSPATPPDDRANGWRLGISQAFELGGQQERRREAAEAELESIDANIAEIRGQVRAEVEERFVQVLALQLRGSVERETASLLDKAAAAVQERLKAGEVSRLDANLARVEAERARNALTQVDEQLTQARAELAATLQLPAAELPEVTGELQGTGRYELSDLLESAAQRQQLRSLERREEAARRRLELERAARVPDVTFGLFTGRDGPPEARESIVGLNVELPLPIFRRNEAAIGRALTDLTQAQIERQAAGRDVPASVRARWQRVTQLEARVSRLQGAVLPALQDNQRLSAIALKEGEIGIAELVLINRQVAEVRRELLEAQAELRRARISLERAAGWPGTDTRGQR